MAILGNQPLLSTMRTVAEGTAYANQVEIPVPGGCIAGLVDVVVNGADLARGSDYDDSNGASIKLTVPMPVGSMFKVTAWTPNQTVVSASGQMPGFRNKLINGNFDVWQRGTSLSAGTGSRYLADRWKTNSTGSTGTPTRQAFAAGDTTVPYQPTYFHRVVVASSAGAGNYSTMSQRIEGVRTLANQTCTLSFWARADATKNIAVEFVQNFGTGGSPSAAVSGIGVATKQLSASLQFFTVTLTLPNISGKTLGTNGDDSLEVIFWFDGGSTYNSRNNTLGQQSGTFDIAQVQLEAGAVATNFEVRPFSTELALCQRFYTKTFPYWIAPANNPSTTQTGAVACMTAGALGYWGGYWHFPVTMRTIPAIAAYSPSSFANNAWVNGSNVASSAVSSFATSDRSVNLAMNGGSSFTPAADIYYVHATADAEL